RLGEIHEPDRPHRGDRERLRLVVRHDVRRARAFDARLVEARPRKPRARPPRLLAAPRAVVPLRELETLPQNGFDAARIMIGKRARRLLSVSGENPHGVIAALRTMRGAHDAFDRAIDAAESVMRLARSRASH